LDLVVHAARGLPAVAARPRPRHEVAREPLPLQEIDGLPHVGDARLDGGTAFLHLVDVLRAPVVGLEPREAQAALGGDVAGAGGPAGARGGAPRRWCPAASPPGGAGPPRAARAPGSGSRPFGGSPTHPAPSAGRARATSRAILRGSTPSFETRTFRPPPVTM